MNYPALIVVAIMALFVWACFHVEKAKQEMLDDYCNNLHEDM